MSNKLLGRVKIVVDGVRYRTKKGARLKVGGTVRTPVTSTDGTVFFTEDIEPSELTFTVLHTVDTDAAAIHSGSTEKTVQFIGDNGVSYSVGNGFSTTPPEIGDEGEVSFTFVGDPAVKL